MVFAAPDRVVRQLAELRREGEMDALVFDMPSSVSELRNRGTGSDTIDRVAAVADLFVTNEVAARSYLDQPPAAAACTLRETGAARVAVTSGAERVVSRRGRQ